MNLLIKTFWLLGLIFVNCVTAKEFQPIEEFRLDEHIVYTIPVGSNRVTTISFPGPVSAIDAAHVTTDTKTPGLFQLAHTKGSYFFSVKALVKKAVTNINVRWNKKTYVLELVESPEALYSVIFQNAPEWTGTTKIVPVTPTRLLALLDKAKGFPVLKLHHPESVAQVEFITYSKQPRVMDYKDYEIQIDEVFRFNPEDTLIFHLTLRNKSEQAIQYKADGFSVRIAERTYFQSVSDASGIMPPKSDTPVYFAITGTPDGGRNDLSFKNEFVVILPRIEAPAATSPEPITVHAE